jgi:hypothetical protein
MVTVERIKKVFEGCDIHLVDCPSNDNYEVEADDHIGIYRNAEKDLILFSSFKNLIEFLDSNADLKSFIDNIKSMMKHIDDLKEGEQHQIAGGLFWELPAIYVEPNWDADIWNREFEKDGNTVKLEISHPGLEFTCNHSEVGSFGFIDNRVPTTFSGPSKEQPTGIEWKLRPEFDYCDGTKGVPVRSYWVWFHDWGDCYQVVVEAEVLLEKITAYTSAIEEKENEEEDED